MEVKKEGTCHLSSEDRIFDRDDRNLLDDSHIVISAVFGRVPGSIDGAASFMCQCVKIQILLHMRQCPADPRRT
jgi:hypothetical protein